MIGNCYDISAHMVLLVETAENFLAIQSVAAFQDDTDGLGLAVVVDCVVNIVNRRRFLCFFD